MNVCLVGNGPLSQDDRKFIESSECDQVWRFNDMKNMRIGERCDGQFVRSFGENYWGIHNPPKFVNKNIPLIAIGEATRELPKDRVQDVLETSRLSYEDCACRNDCTSNANWHFTSGAIGISYFEKRQDVKTINILGMNFSRAKDSQHEEDEKAILDACCTKCNIRPTFKNTYLP